MKTKKYDFTKQYGENEYTISVCTTNKQIRFFYDNIYIGNIKYRSKKEIKGCNILDKDTYVFVINVNNTRTVYTFNTINEAVAKAEDLFQIKMPANIVDTFSSNELLNQLANKI